MTLRTTLAPSLTLKDISNFYEDISFVFIIVCKFVLSNTILSKQLAIFYWTFHGRGIEVTSWLSSLAGTNLNAIGGQQQNKALAS